jgi:predicted Zn-ribbon and HTH transcriptional regulator
MGTTSSTTQWVDEFGATQDADTVTVTNDDPINSNRIIRQVTHTNKVEAMLHLLVKPMQCQNCGSTVKVILGYPLGRCKCGVKNYIAIDEGEVT